MQTSPQMRAMIEGWEGCLQRAYPDPASHGVPWTIGYGHTGPDVHPGMQITLTQANALLAADLATFEAGVAERAPKCTQQQFDALVSFSYNLGLGALGGSTLLRLHNAGDYAAAAEQFKAWDRPTNLPGILRRRLGEAAVYSTGAYTGAPIPAAQVTRSPVHLSVNAPPSVSTVGKPAPKTAPAAVTTVGYEDESEALNAAELASL